MNTSKQLTGGIVVFYNVCCGATCKHIVRPALLYFLKHPLWGFERQKDVTYVSRVTRLCSPLFRAVGRSVGLFVPLLLSFMFRRWPHCSCPNALVTSNTALAHPHATEVAVCPALFSLIGFFRIKSSLDSFRCWEDFLILTRRAKRKAVLVNKERRDKKWK